MPLFKRSKQSTCPTSPAPDRLTPNPITHLEEEDVPGLEHLRRGHLLEEVGRVWRTQDDEVTQQLGVSPGQHPGDWKGGAWREVGEWAGMWWQML